MVKDRADKVLVKMGLVDSRSKAQALIQDNLVMYQNKLLTKCSLIVDSDFIQVTENISRVGRGGKKIEGIANDFKISISELIVADIGASTGGFTEEALKLGAKKVFAIDVGRDQLAEKLKRHPKVINMEGVNIKDGCNLEVKVDIVLVDLSFISLRLVLENVFDLLKDNGQGIVLFKPQFEVGRKGVGKNGIVKGPKLVRECLFEFFKWCDEKKIYIKNFKKAIIPGKGGNQEFFFHFIKSAESSIDWSIIESELGEKL